ncbi:MAG: sodium-dependent transporter, partial [Pseudomonadales bacterium]
MAARAEFSSRFGFIMAAAGSAVGLGNIWGFPTQVAGNGGAAFVFVYIVLAFVLAYPILMAELVIGRYANANMVAALNHIAVGTSAKTVGRMVGYWGLVVASLILSFYAIIAGWMLAYGLQAICEMLGLHSWSSWLTEFSLTRNIVFTALFATLTGAIVYRGVSQGIERWSSRLMP